LRRAGAALFLSTCARHSRSPCPVVAQAIRITRPEPATGATLEACCVSNGNRVVHAWARRVTLGAPFLLVDRALRRAMVEMLPPLHSSSDGALDPPTDVKDSRGFAAKYAIERGALDPPTNLASGAASPSPNRGN
jgi:hypothetical protein